MKIAFAASEMVPYAKTGGLADVVGALAPEIAKLGHEVTAFVPRFKTVDIHQWKLHEEIHRLAVPLGAESETGRIFRHEAAKGLRVFLVDHPEFFCRDGLYGTPVGDYPDNDRRFIFFQRAVLETLRHLRLHPDVLHCHDWQTALIPVYLKRLYARNHVFRGTRTVLTIHNLSYQGNFPPDSLAATGLEWNEFRMERLEYYGKVSFLKGGLLDADALTTVSERYGQEMQTKEFGCGLEGILVQRRRDLHGILNGIDPKKWNPLLPGGPAASFGPRNMGGKAAHKEALQRENGFAFDPKAPLLGVISRLVEQKGIDNLVGAVPQLMELGVSAVVLGVGEDRYHGLLRSLAEKYPRRFRVHLAFDEEMARRIYAGSDLFLLPSLFEPCGLGQMIAMRFGTIPVVRETGGLADTVQEFDPKKGKGNGFVYRESTPAALVDAVRRALRVYRDGALWRKLVGNAMACDFSWKASAEKYLRLYRSL